MYLLHKTHRTAFITSTLPTIPCSLLLELWSRNHWWFQRATMFFDCDDHNIRTVGNWDHDSLVKNVLFLWFWCSWKNIIVHLLETCKRSKFNNGLANFFDAWNDTDQLRGHRNSWNDLEDVFFIFPQGLSIQDGLEVVDRSLREFDLGRRKRREIRSFYCCS